MKPLTEIIDTTGEPDIITEILDTALRNPPEGIKKRVMKAAYINPTTGKHEIPTSEADKKRMVACGWRKIKKPVLIDIHNRKIN